MKGEKHLIHFGFSIIKVKVVEEFGNYVRVRHWNTFSDMVFPFYQTIRKSELIDVNN